MPDKDPSQDALEKLAAAIRKVQSSRLKEKEDLLRLLTGVQGELRGLADTHREHAARIAGAVGKAAHEASRPATGRGGMESHLKALEASIEGFETTHPKLVMAINGISTLLARIGV